VGYGDVRGVDKQLRFVLETASAPMTQAGSDIDISSSLASRRSDGPASEVLSTKDMNTYFIASTR
jgi:hypothetical protein